MKWLFSFFLIIPLNIYANESSLFSSGEHCVAYKTVKRLALIKKVDVVGKNCNVSAQMLPDVGGVYEFELLIPISDFESGEMERDRDVRKLLKMEQQAQLIFRSEKYSKQQWQHLLKKKKKWVKGRLNIGGQDFAVRVQVAVEHLDPKKMEVDGVLMTRFDHFNIKPPKLIGGLAAKVDEALELHFHLLGSKTLGLSSIFED